MGYSTLFRDEYLSLQHTSAHSTASACNKFQMTSAYLIVTMARLLLGVSILSFPLFLPFLIFSFFADEDGDEGTPNEEIWAREGKTRLRITSSHLCNRIIYFQYSYTLLLEYPSSESASSPALAAETRLSEEIELCSEDSNGLRITTFIAHESSYNVGQQF